MLRKTAVSVLAALLMTGPACADTIVLKNGQSLDGKVLKEDEHGILLEVAYGTMWIAHNKILSHDEDTPEALAAREKQAQAARDLAGEMRAQHKVLYKGKWVAEEEKQAAEQKLADAKKKRDEEHAAARKKAEEEADAKKKKAEEDAQKLAAERQKAQSAEENLSAREKRLRRHGNFDAADAESVNISKGTVNNNTNRIGRNVYQDWLRNQPKDQ